MNDWISVEDELPVYSAWCWLNCVMHKGTIHEREEVHEGQFEEDGFEPRDGFITWWNQLTVTHWQYKPAVKAPLSVKRTKELAG